LDDLAKKYFDYKMISYDEITDKNSINFSQVDLEKASVYSAEDVYITSKIYNKQKED
jgi:DNA polymerase-1